MDAQRSAQLVRDRNFGAHLSRHQLEPLVRDSISTLQVNLGKLCNQACLHCHVEAGPLRTEMMTREVAEAVMTLLERTPSIEVVDLTGGAPELNPHFRWLVQGARELGRSVIDRCNLTVLFEPGMEDLAEFLASHKVRMVASLPCYTEEIVDAQRGGGAFSRSIRAIRWLNTLGYGDGQGGLQLDLVYNPLGASLPPPQESLEQDYKKHLKEQFGLRFDRLLAMTNLPVKRFSESLHRSGELPEYLDLLETNFNPSTVAGLMCRDTISVGWDGALYDCDFNQMLELGMTSGNSTPIFIQDLIHLDELIGQPILTGGHCLGCCAGSGSSCGGTLLDRIASTGEGIDA